MRIVLEECFPQYVYTYGNIISIPLLDIDEINAMIDEERAANGKRPFFDDLHGLAADIDGWYEVRLILDRETCEPVEIEAWVAPDCGAEENDDNIYHFEIDDKESVKEQLLKGMESYEVTPEDFKEYR